MGMVDNNCIKKLKSVAVELKSGTKNALDIIKELPELLNINMNTSVPSITLYSIYLHIHNALSKIDGEEEMLALEEKFMDFLKIRNDNFEGLEGLTLHQQITAFCFMGIMQQSFVEQIEDYEYEFDNLVNTLPLDGINRFFDKTGNTPIIWSIANSQLPSLHKLLEALEKKGVTTVAQIDTHCTDYTKGSALFLACLKGEAHQDVDRSVSSDPLAIMRSAIKRLLDFGASPTDKCEDGMQYSPLEIMVMRRSPDLVELMIEHLKSPLDEEQLSRLQFCLDMNYEDVVSQIKPLTSVGTLPEKGEWENNSDKMQSIFAGLSPDSQQQLGSSPVLSQK